MDIGTILIIIFVAVVAGVAIYIGIKRLNSTWKGALVDKRAEERQVKDPSNRVDHMGRPIYRTEIVYKMTFQTDGGQRIAMDVNQELYDLSAIGDKFEKVKGQYNPQRIAEAQLLNQ